MAEALSSQKTLLRETAAAAEVWFHAVYFFSAYNLTEFSRPLQICSDSGLLPGVWLQVSLFTSQISVLIIQKQKPTSFR